MSWEYWFGVALASAFSFIYVGFDPPPFAGVAFAVGGFWLAVAAGVLIWGRP